MSHGANGLIYWKWNPFRKGVQTFGRGLVDLQDRETPRLETARRLGAVLEQERALATCHAAKPATAILFDPMNQDFIKAYTVGFGGAMGAKPSLYHDSLMGLYVSYYLIGFVGAVTILASSFSAIVRVWNGITDPLIGLIIDKTDGKFGKNRPFNGTGEFDFMCSQLHSVSCYPLSARVLAPPLFSSWWRIAEIKRKYAGEHSNETV